MFEKECWLSTTSATARLAARRLGHPNVDSPTLDRIRNTIEEDRHDAVSVAATIPTKRSAPA